MPDTYTLLEKVVVGAAGASTVTFTSIPQTYTDLLIKISARTDSGARYGVGFIRPNGATTNLTAKTLEGIGSGVTSYNETVWRFEPDGGIATASTFGNAEIYISNYTSANNKSASADTVSENNQVNADMYLKAWLWSNSAAITSLDIVANAGQTFQQYSTFYLYGIAKLGVTPTSAPKATGGDIIVSDGTYWYHAFTSSGTFRPSVSLSCDALVIAGGAGGGGTASAASPAGGGGAGGIFYATAQGIYTAQTVTIGAGGATSTAGSNVNGNAGNNSIFGSLTTAIGGGFGSGGSAGGNGGSGGGGRNGGSGGTSTQTGTGGTGYGSNGGAGFQFAGGGGGGAGAVGSAGQNIGVGSQGGAGGAGLNTWSSWLSTVGLGVSGFVAGGGGGGSYSASNSSGGSGGGGAGSATSGVAGTANTGSGGGGSGSNGSSNAGGAGGSGLVIVRYAV